MSLSIDEKLAGHTKASNKQFIFRVNDRLRKQNEEAFEPEIVSIGPYNHGNEKLKKMEKYKLQCLQEILERRGEATAVRYIAALRKVEKEARDCYAEDISLSSDDFVGIMLLDGCFIIEFLRKKTHIVEISEDDHIFSMRWYQRALCRDLLRFENQLPFFILELLFDMTMIENSQDGDLIFLSISSLMVCFELTQASRVIDPPEDKAFHLLRLMHDSW